MPSLVELATDLLKAATALESHLQASNLPNPDHDNDLLSSLSPDLQAHRLNLINSADNIKQLALGPNGVAVDLFLSWTSHVSWRVIYAYNVAAHVPEKGSCSYGSLAEATGLPESILRRVLRHCMGNHIFAQTSMGEVRHTATSRMMAVDSDFNDAVGLELDEFMPASTSVLDAIRKFGDSGEERQIAFTLSNQSRGANGSDKDAAAPLKSTFEILAEHPERARRLGAGMRYFTRDDQRDPRHLLAGFDWTKVDVPGNVMVDVGGGVGTISQFLAHNTQHLRFVVQDLPGTVDIGQKQLPEELHDRIEFAPHDFFTPQKEGARIFFMRWIVHNWADKKAIALLKALASGMREGSQLVIFDYLVKDEPQTLATEKLTA